MTKKRRFRNSKNLLKGLQQFLSFPTSPGYQKNTILISSDRKKEFNEFTKQSIFTWNWNEKQLINKNTIKR